MGISKENLAEVSLLLSNHTKVECDADIKKLLCNFKRQKLITEEEHRRIETIIEKKAMC